MPLNKRSIATVFLAWPLAACSGVLDPQGPVGFSEKLILLDSLSIMLAIVVPVIAATIGFAWWFRASNARATYRPDWVFSGHLELIIWAIPTLVITFLGGIAWFGSHALDPYKSLSSSVKPIEIEVVSIDWKWLFIYPGGGVATVNQLTIPVGTPIHFRLTSSGVMNSFFVPQLGSQIYTMAGMSSQVSLEADRPGQYSGLSAQFSGAGFADMHFVVNAVPADAYEKWLARTRMAGPTLDRHAYAALEASGTDHAPASYKAIDPGLFAAIVRQTLSPSSGGQRNSPAKRAM